METNASPADQAQADMATIAESAIQARLRERLLSDSVKLWQQPFFDEKTNTVNETEILALASRYATEIEMQESDVVDTLLQIQRNAIERLTERDHYRTTGLATLRVKQANQTQKIQVDLSTTTGKALKTTVAQIMNLAEGKLKLISSGKVVVDTGSLAEQGIKNGSNLLVLLVGGSGTGDKNSVGESVFKDLEEIKSSADYLAGKDSGGKYSLQVADQSGRALELPDSEKKALAMSLALHDKGRAALKVKDYAKALVFLLEADSVYSQCQSSILEMVDNFGMLNLDIAWCYLCLQSITDLPAVEIRLAKCEKALHKSYGENFERVIALQGSMGAEAALFVRLHLLQGIAAFHLGQTEKAKFLVTKVNTEISRFQISDDQLADLINMGYTAAESRSALRATFGEITAAVDWIIRKREEMSKVRAQEKEDAQRRKLQKKLGKCINGEPVNVALYRNLQDMGFNALLAKESLKRTNNDINAALQLVNDDEFICSVTLGQLQQQPPGSTPVNPAPGSSSVAIPNSTGETASGAGPSGADSHSSLNSLDDLMEQQQSVEEEMKSLKALETLSKDTCPESEYIDLSLSDETAFLNIYKELLKM